MLPSTPLFWIQTDTVPKTIRLFRTSLWLHEATIEWLAQTNEVFPPELADTVLPRIKATCKRLGLDSKIMQPGRDQTPKAGRWIQAHHATAKASDQPQQPQPAPDAHMPQQTSPVKDDTHTLYLKMQAGVQAMYMSVGTNLKSEAATAQTASAEPSTAPAKPTRHDSADNQPIATGTASSTVPPDEPPKHDTQTSKIDAQTLAEVRPPPPPTPGVPDPQEVTPVSGAVSSGYSPSCSSHTHCQGSVGPLASPPLS